MTNKTIRGFELSPQQRRLWLLQQSEREHLYVTQCAVLLDGSLNKQILRSALAQVMERHAILRTTFEQLPGLTVPLQTVNEVNPVALIEYDLSEWDADETETRIEMLLEEARRAPLDFQHGPLLRMFLVKLDANKHVLIINASVLYVDTMGLRNLLAEIKRCYDASLHHQVLNEEPLQYAALSGIFNELLESAETRAGREYWEKQNYPDFKALKLVYAKEPVDSFSPRQIDITVDSELLRQIESFALSRGVSTTGFLLACWEVLLWSLSGQTQILVGTATDGRNYEELETAIGLCARYLPVQCRLEDSSLFTEILQQLNDTMREV